MRVCPECDTRTEDERCPVDGRVTVELHKLKVVKTDPLVGTVIEGKYRIERRLGRGGYGAVYRASHVETGGAVAVKLIRGDLVDNDSVIRRFYIEAQNTHKLHHPNTVRVSDFGRTEDGMLYLVMEFVSGVPLTKIIKREGRLEPRRVIHIASQILKSLGEAHSHQLVHRDVKPENVMLVDQFGEPDFVKVLDFGISRSLVSTGASTRGALGTPRYMAPEQWLSKPVDGRTDIYSLACIMYEMLAGREAYQVDVQGTHTEVALAYMTAHMTQRPAPLEQVAAGLVPPALCRLVDMMMAKHPDARPADAEAVLNAMMEIRDGREPEFLVASAPKPGPNAGEAPEPGGQTGADESLLSLPPEMLYDRDPTERDRPAADVETGDFKRPEEALAEAPGPAAPPETVPIAHAPPAARNRRSWVPLAIAGAGVALIAVVLVLALGGGPDAPETPAAEAPVATAPATVTPTPEPLPPAESAPDASQTAPDASAPSAAPPPAEVAPAPPPEEPKSTVATVKLVSKPEGAEVRDQTDSVLGNTPLELESPPMKLGQKVFLQHPGHRRQELLVGFPEPGQATTVMTQLEPLPKAVLMTEPAGAEVTVKELELSLGATPLEATLPEPVVKRLEAGKRLSFVFHADGHAPKTKKVKAKDIVDGQLALTLKLKKRKAGKGKGGKTLPPLKL